MALFDYWLDFPTMNTMVRNYLGYERRRKPDAFELGSAIRSMSGKGRAKSISRAPLYIQKMAEEAKKAKKNG